MVVVTPGGCEFYMDNFLKENLEQVKKKVNEKDEDYFLVVDGGEGVGKSVFTMQMAKYLDPSFCLERVVFSAEEFRDAILKAQKGQAVVFDEAFRGLNSRAALSEVNRLLVQLMMESRQKNLFVFLVLPSFFLLDRYAALHRSKGLFHVYRSEGRRGHWAFFNGAAKKTLWIYGRKEYNYDFPKSTFRGRFTDRYVVDEVEYRAKKMRALMETERSGKSEQYLAHRNLLLWLLVREQKVTTTALSQRLKALAWEIEHNTISEAVIKAEKSLKTRGVLL